MANSNIPEIILKETKHLPDDLLQEVLDFVLFLKSKKQKQPAEAQILSTLQQNELIHLEEEFEDYKNLYPHE